MFRRRWIRLLLQQIAPASREDVSARYWNELQDLLAQGELSLEVARKIEQDMFEPAIAGEPRNLNDASWQIYLDGRRANLHLAMVSAMEDSQRKI